MFLDSINLSQFIFSLDLLKGFPLLYSGYDGSFQQLWVGQAPGGPSALATRGSGGGGAGIAGGGCSLVTHGLPWLLEGLPSPHSLYHWAQPRSGAAECLLASGQDPRLEHADLTFFSSTSTAFY